jgi:phage-related protein
MSEYTDRLKDLREHAKDARNETARIEESWPDDATRKRFESVLAYATVVLEATDADLVSEAAADEIRAALYRISTDATSVPANADSWSEAVLDGLAKLPVSRGREVEQAVKDAAATFQRSSQQRLAAVSDDVTTTKNAVEELKTSIEERRAELASTIEDRKNEIKTEIESLETGFHAKLTEFEAQVAAERSALSELRSTHTSEHEEAEEQRRAAAKERLETAEKELARFQAEAKQEVEERVAEIRRMENESAQLVGAIGLAGTAERYGEEVTEQKNVANNWRRATVLLALLAVAGVILAATEKHPAAETFAGKLTLSLILGGIAAYAARQSSYHRKREQRARDLQLELTAFSPFIEPLSAEQQEEERVIMTRKTFGKTTTSEAPDEEPGPTPLSFALRRKEKEPQPE